jgi:hypothetical protein
VRAADARHEWKRYMGDIIAIGCGLAAFILFFAYVPLCGKV